MRNDGYQGSGGRRDLLHTDVVTAAGKALWNSETTGGSDLYKPHVSGKSLSVLFAPKSIQTLQVDGVTV